MSVVACPSCQKKFTLSSRIAGRQVKCQCGNVFRMPGMAQSSPAQTSSVSSSSAVIPDPSKIQFQCPGCQRIHAVDRDAAGKISTCPCGKKIRVPTPASQSELPTTNLFEPMSPVDSPLAPPPVADPNQDLFGGGDQLYSDDGLFGASSTQVDPLPGAAPGGYQPAPYQPAPYNPPKKRRRKSKPAATQLGDETPLHHLLSSVAVMVIAAVWFVVGLYFGRWFKFPPFLFIAGCLSSCVAIFRWITSE